MKVPRFTLNNGQLYVNLDRLLKAKSYSAPCNYKSIVAASLQPLTPCSYPYFLILCNKRVAGAMSRLCNAQIGLQLFVCKNYRQVFSCRGPNGTMRLLTNPEFNISLFFISIANIYTCSSVYTCTRRIFMIFMWTFT